jgi:hypothetical protein
MCDLGEGTIASVGWRRLLMFSAVVQNNGAGPLSLGDPSSTSNPYNQANNFQYAPCHNHYHFSFYGSFQFKWTLNNGQTRAMSEVGGKQAFCLEDTGRFLNYEHSPIKSAFDTCQRQVAVNYRCVPNCRGAAVPASTGCQCCSPFRSRSKFRCAKRVRLRYYRLC